MTDDPHRIATRCSKCDHPIVTLPEDYHFTGIITCPGCGETFESPETVETAEKEGRTR